MIAGPVGTATAVDFPIGTGIEDLAAKVSQAVDDLVGNRSEGSTPEKVLILTDVTGGSPARIALGEALRGRAEVLAGVNLPMLLEALFTPPSLDLRDVVERVMSAAQAGIRNLGSEIRRKEELA